MSWSDEPIRDFERYDSEKEEATESFPHCDCCGEVIYEYLWEIDGETYCEDCLNENFRRSVD